MIRVSEAQLQAIRQHGAETFPLECCGVILGDVESGVKIVREIRPLENVFEADPAFEAQVAQATHNEAADAFGQERRYTIPPDVMFGLMQEERRTKRRVLGFYHSHPNHPAQPSFIDLAVAHSGYTYIIVSILQGKPADLTAWTLNEAGDAFVAEDVDGM